MHFDGLAELVIQAEADEHGPVRVNLQLRALAELLGVLDRQRVQPKASGELVDISSVGSSISSQKGWPASTACAINDEDGSQTTSPERSIQLRTAADYAISLLAHREETFPFTTRDLAPRSQAGIWLQAVG